MFRKSVSTRKGGDCTSHLHKAFKKVKEEFDDHLDAINENTNEIQSNHEYIRVLDSKIDKLAERLDELTMLFKQNFTEEKTEFSVLPLTKREKEVFLALYLLEAEVSKVSYEDIARNCGLSEELTQSYIANLIEKGVPVLKRYVNNRPFLKLDPLFRQQQTKEDIVGIGEISEGILVN